MRKIREYSINIQPGSYMSSIDWQQAVYDVIKSGGIGLIGYVPDAGHATLINSAKADDAMRDVVNDHRGRRDTPVCRSLAGWYALAAADAIQWRGVTV